MSWLRHVTRRRLSCGLVASLLGLGCTPTAPVSQPQAHSEPPQPSCDVQGWAAAQRGVAVGEAWRQVPLERGSPSGNAQLILELQGSIENPPDADYEVLN